MTTPPRKPVPRTATRPSRPSASRPRRVAGSTAGSPVGRESDPATGTPVDVDPTVGPDIEPHVVVETVEPATVEVLDETATPSAPPEPAPRTGASLLTMALSVLVVLLLALGGAELRYLFHGGRSGDAVVSADHPVVVSDLTARSVVDQAARDAATILSVSYTTFDQQVAKAAATMTPTFAAQFTTTKVDIKPQFVAQKAEVTTQVANQGVVSASADEVIALLFLTETTQKTSGTTSSQFRVLVTMTHTDAGWLVSQLKAE